MWNALKFTLGLSEAEMFAVPAPHSGTDHLPVASADWPGRPYRPYWDAVRRRPGVHRLLAELSARWNTEIQLARLKAQPRGREETFKFVVVGDAEPGRFKIWRRLFNEEGVFARQLALIGERKCDFVLQLGDMVSRGLPDQFEKFLALLEASGLKVPYLTVLGNHDRHFPHGRADASVYRKVFGAPNYAFDRGPARFIVVDTSDAGLTPARLRWLDKVLGSARGRRKLVFTHKPPREFTRWTSAGIGGFARGSHAFLRLMARHRVDRVYMGHIHGFGVQEHRGVRYVLTGGGGSPLFPSGAPEKFHHHLLVEAGPGGVRETVVRLDGSERAFPPRH